MSLFLKVVANSAKDIIADMKAAHNTPARKV